ncbi:sodium-coupled monocarboxylate transporter 1 [Anopheles funestus]|uniref:sodium-coupled monocarboxylate transporter 1 n=1 Tax=Anopheles funestus TaxID=62324 RepID=UPI0020C70CC3|nr:sodium-coupled monocarboxylate transporter 1 [Anopheles funestus]XP_049292414.1 sodium-coupled monocarboxylate transporter 1 [Anopheles funestus]XP_049292415.1 sodium-coupled monocarboxylate transporter 1 [Anopheles funestus]XP_049292416.1 sodium-coupled monocarboxylate transporter 1 [Anopheles funestus]XP_049292417.1 sodium-coupled monocarboxylate transporter 1 [Anopheles funestus]XP_049292418.1 sodium-coupled monocarboxylate transporter 1 [Anopheles funestus]XP_049292420.1 sodium-coupled
MAHKMSTATVQWWCFVVLVVCFVALGAVESASTRLGGVAEDDVELRSDSEGNEPSGDSKPSFTVYDYLVVGSMLVISIGIGVFYGWFEPKGTTDVNGCEADSSNDFLLGSGMSLFPVTLSLTTSFITAIELLGNPSEMFFNGTQFSLIVISMVLVVPIAVKVFYPIYYKLEVTSCYEYLGMRFDKRIRIFGAVLYILQMLFYTSVAVLAPAIALSEATGLNKYIAVVLIYFVCIFYSSQGGMKAVVIADTFQAFVLLLSLILILVLGTHYSAGLSEVFSRAAEHERIEFFNFDPDPTTRHSVFSVIIGGFFYWTSMFCTNQASVQKCMSLKSLKTAKLALYFSLIGLIAVFLMNFYTGLMTFAHYSDCDPLAVGQITAKDQLLPFYVMDVFGHIKCMAGIFVAGIFAASLGTVAAALNSLAAVASEDLLEAGMEIKIPDGKGALYAKWMSLGFGLVSFGLVFVVERLGGILQATLTLNGLIGGVTLGLFSLGIFFRRANSKGALFGGIVSIVVVIVVGVLAQLNNGETPPLPSSVDGCNVTIPLNSPLTHEGFAYEIAPSDGLVSVALQHSGNEAFEHLLTIATKDGWSNGGELENNFYRLSNDDAAPSLQSDVLKVSTRQQEDSTDGASSWFAAVYQISYMWYSCLGTLLTVIFGLLISLFTSDSSWSCWNRSTIASVLPTSNMCGNLQGINPICCR